MLLVVYSRPLRNETQTVDAAKTNRGQLIHPDQIYRVGYNHVRLALLDKTLHGQLNEYLSSTKLCLLLA